MNQSNVASRYAIILDLINRTYRFNFIYFLSNGLLIYHQGNKKQWGKWYLKENILTISIHNSFRINCRIIDNDIIQGNIISKNENKDEFIALLYDKVNYGDLKANICFLLNQYYIPEKRLNGYISPCHLDKFLTKFNKYNSGIILMEIYNLIEKFWHLKYMDDFFLLKLIRIASNKRFLNNIDKIILRLSFLEFPKDDFIEKLGELNQEIVIIIKLIEHNKTVWEQKNISEQDLEKIVTQYENTQFYIKDKYERFHKIDTSFFVTNPYRLNPSNYSSFDDHVYNDLS